MDERVFLMDLPKDGEKLKWQASLSRDMESQPAVKLLRSLMRNFENEALIANKALVKTYANTILDVVTTHGLEEYFERAFQTNAVDFLNAIEANSGAGVNMQNVSISKLIN